MSLLDIIRGNKPKIEQGRVVTASLTSVAVRVGGRTRNIPRTTALALKPGDRVNIQGNIIVGRRKPPPTDVVYQV